MAVALINGRNFVHKDIVFNWGGVPITSLSNLSMDSSKTREFSYGTGNLPVGYGDGHKQAEAVSFEISMTDYIALTRATDTGDVKDLDPVDIPVTFLNTSNPAGVVIKNVLVTEDNFSSETDNTDIKISVTAIASHKVWQ